MRQGAYELRDKFIYTLQVTPPTLLLSSNITVYCVLTKCRVIRWSPPGLYWHFPGPGAGLAQFQTGFSLVLDDIPGLSHLVPEYLGSMWDIPGPDYPTIGMTKGVIASDIQEQNKVALTRNTQY